MDQLLDHYAMYSGSLGSTKENDPDDPSKRKNDPSPKTLPYKDDPDDPDDPSILTKLFIFLSSAKKRSVIVRHPFKS